MALDILDPRVRIIVTLRRNGHGDDEVTSFMSLFDSVAKANQERLAQLVTVEDKDIIRRLVAVLPDVHAALMKKNGKTPEELIEEAAKGL
jgi:replicative DNA helicase